MTVAAVILAASPASALAVAAGQPSVRRIAELAWAGGALPIVVVFVALQRTFIRGMTAGAVKE